MKCKISAMIVTCVAFWVFPQIGIYPEIQEFELTTSHGPILAIKHIPAPKKIPALLPLQVSTSTTSTTTTAFQRRSQEQEYFWMLLSGPLFLSIITITMCVTVWCHIRRVSTYREHERTQNSSQEMMSVHQWECVLLETKNMLVEFQKSTKLCAQAQKELHAFSLTAKVEDENFVQLRNELDKTRMIMKAQDEYCNKLLTDSAKTIEIEREEPPYFQNEGDSARETEMEEECPADSENERYSESYFALRRERQRLRLHKRGVHIMPPLIDESEYENEEDANSQDHLKSVRSMQMEEECLADVDERYSPSYFQLRRKRQRLRLQQRGVHITPPLMEEEEEEEEDEDEDDANSQDQLNSVMTIEMEKEQPPHFQNERDSARTVEKEEERPVHFQNEGDSLRTVDDEEERPAHFQNEGSSVRNLKVRADEHSLSFQQTEMPIIMEEDEQDAHPQIEVHPLNIKAESLPLTITEETVGHQVTMESPVEMGGRRKNCIAASKPTVEKKMGVALGQPPNLKARTAKAVSQSSSNNRSRRSNVKIYSKKMDYSKIKAKVDTWRKAPATE